MVLVPIVKDKRASVCSTSNYRPIALGFGHECERLPHDSKIANIMKQDQMTNLIKIK